MRTKIIGIFVLALLLLLTVSVASAKSKGHHYTQLQNAGWFCTPIPFGDELWPHCFPPDSFPPTPGPSGNLPASIVVKVFDDILVPDGGFYLGSEILIREDLYNWQPCMQDGGGPYHFLGSEGGLPYYACHHFDTLAALDS